MIVEPGFRTGTLLGLAWPALVLLPALAWGHLGAWIQSGIPYILLPLLAPLLLPAVFAGLWAAQSSRNRRTAWRFAAGLFLGGSLSASLFIAAGTAQYGAARQVLLSLFGGPMIAGSWLFLGCLLGLHLGFQRRERARNRAASST